MIRKIDKKTFLVDGEAEIEDVETRLKVKLAFDDSDFETISGLVLHVLGRVPSEGEDVILDKMSIHVEKMDRQKIVSLKVVKK